MTSLSKSALWQKMQDYYHNMGPEAWQNELVPLQISSNKNLAISYANIIVGQINDWYSNNPHTANEQPFYIVEIGTGHGKFGFYVLKCLQELMLNYDLPMTLIKFIMTDVAEKNINSWEQHPAFKPWVAAGNLDFALFNAMSDQEICLRNSGAKIQPGTLNKPIFMLCNYLFDSLSHDAFQVRDHKLHEVQIKINSDADWEEYFAKASFTYTYEPVGADYYADKNLNKILADYQTAMTNGTFMIPIGGIDCINTLQKFSKEHLVLLLADKGQASIDLFDDLGEPDISVHGSISLMVNFDALKRYFNNNNGTAMLMHNTSVDFQVACYSTQAKYSMPHTKHAFAQTLSAASPQDIINLCYLDDEINTNFSNLDQLLAILNLTVWDPNIFYDFHEMILDRIEIEEITVEQDKALLCGAKIVWDYFFKLEKNQDLPFALGSLYYALDEYETALEFYKISIQEFGANAESLYNMAITYQALEQTHEARQFAEQSLQLDAKYTAAKELLAEL
jgi:tetratricopeptide (TPR) repeat protein